MGACEDGVEDKTGMTSAALSSVQERIYFAEVGIGLAGKWSFNEKGGIYCGKSESITENGSNGPKRRRNK